MNENQNDSSSKRKPRRPRQMSDLITLTPEARQIVDQRIAELVEGRLGFRISRRDYINWRVVQDNSPLSEKDKKQLTNMFFNEKTFMKDCLSKVEEAKQRGVQIDIRLLFKQLFESV